jgi:hypothetical protein
MKIVNELSSLAPHTEETNILTFDDPELFKYPVAYLCEPAGWVMSDEEAAGLRAYLKKGGFVIVDDFRFQRLEQLRDADAARAAGGALLRLDLENRSSTPSSRSRRSTSRSTTTRRRRFSGGLRGQRSARSGSW